MTRIEREQLIERYVQGMMPSSEEERFLIEVASDPELRFELKASQVIDRAISKDRSRGVIPTGKMRANIALLAAPINSVPSDAHDSVSTTPGGWFSGWTAGLGGVVALIIVGSLVFSGDPGQDRQELSAPAEQVITLQQEDLPPIDEVTEFEEPIPVDMISVVTESRPQKKVEPQRLINRIEPNSTHLNGNAREMSNPTRNQHPTLANIVPPITEPLDDPVAPLITLDTGASNLIDQGVNASDTTNSGSPSMKLLFDQSDGTN